MKKVLIGIGIVVLAIVLVLKGLEWWLETQFDSMINSNPDRGYNIVYADFDLHTFFKGVTLDKMRIEPLKSEGAVIEGSVDHATISGLVWTQLLLGKRLSLNQITFNRPVFHITPASDTTKKTNGAGMQKLFGDILSRANVGQFSINNGSVVIFDPESGDERGRVSNVSVIASDLITDSMHFKHMIPFEMGNMQVSVDSAKFALNEYTNLKLGKLEFDLKDQIFSMQDVDLGYSIGWVEVSRKKAVQKDVIEFHLDELSIHALENSSSFYSQLDIIARKVKVDGLDIKFQKNKNYNRPPDTYKPMFQGLIDAIPVKLYLDSVEIANSDLTYAELGKHKSETGEINVNEINGYVQNLTNFKDQQAVLGKTTTALNAKLLGKADLKVDLTIPYDDETFQLTIDVGKVHTRYLNPTLMPLVGIEFTSGQIHRIHYKLNAGPKTGQHSLVFDYQDLKLSVINRDETGQKRKDGFLSTIANAAIRPNNMPGEKKYLTASYQTERNIYRAPINYFIKGLMEGAIRIVPGKTVRSFLVNDKKKKKK